MFEHLEQIEKRYVEIEQDLTKQEVLSDIKQTRILSKELSELESVVNCYREYKRQRSRRYSKRRISNFRT